MDMLQELHDLLTDYYTVAAKMLQRLCQSFSSCRYTLGLPVVFLLKVPLWNHRKATRVSASWMGRRRSRNCHYPRSADKHTNDVTNAELNHAAGIFTLAVENIDHSSKEWEFIIDLFYNFYLYQMQFNQSRTTTTSSCHRNNRPKWSFLYEEQFWFRK